jgi:ferrochelatase
MTARQAEALERALAANGSFLVRPCMRYWHPFAAAALMEMSAAEVTEIIALPLYPHYCQATSGSSLHDLREQNRKLGLNLPLREIRSWPTEPGYIASLAARVQEGLARFGNETVQVVYSAHSLPKKFIAEGDPYLDELRQTIAALEQQTGKQGQLCFQSRSGPVQWLEPSTEDMLIQLAVKGCKNILMVPISFVSDHIETLYEIDMLYKRQAELLEMRLESTRGLNDDPLFIGALKKLVMRSRDLL